MSTEQWRLVQQFPDYEVSDLGRVRRVTPTRGGKSYVGLVLKQGASEAGYHHVTLSGERRTTRSIHRLVLEAFAGPPAEGQLGCHRDGNRSNNCLQNLRWDTQVGNLSDRIAHGTEIRGSRNGRAKLTPEQVAEIRARYSPRHTSNGAAALAIEFGVTDVAVIKAARGETWSHLRSR